jgi:hypothetical protein
MFEPKDMRTGYYRVRKGNFPRSLDGVVHPHWSVARWMPAAEEWRTGNDGNFPRGHWDEIGDKVA